jgi:predicted RNA-binding protein Jag
MREYIDVTGKNEEEAIAKALEQLGMDRDDVSVEVLERAKSGFLGLGSCPAKVRVSYGPEEEEIPAPVVAEEKVVEPAPAVEEKMVEPAPVAQNAPVQVEIAVKAPQVEVAPAPVQEAVKAEAPAPVETPRSENKDARLITDLRKAIGLNDRFRLKHDLFDNNEALLFNTIDALNSMETFAQADAYLKSNFNWNADDATVVYFYDMLQRKFV